VVGRAIEAANSWLKNRADDAELLLALGRLLNTNKQQEQARQHLLRAVQVIGLTTRASQNPKELEGLILTELGRSGITQ
jgi:uncharacterized protein HemY